MPVAPLEDKEQLEQQFLAFLRAGGFPDFSIYRGPCFDVREPATWRRALSAWAGRMLGAEREEQAFPRYADMAILDLDSREYIALVEFRLCLDETVETEMAQFFRGILGHIAVKPPVFLVAPLMSSGFRVCQLRQNGVWQQLPNGAFPGHATLVAGHAAEKAYIQEAEQGRALDHFTVTCHALAGALCLVSLASLGKLASLTNNEMLLLSLAALLVVAPLSIGLRLSSGRTRPRFLRPRPPEGRLRNLS